jgi:hypothetical protein
MLIRQTLRHFQEIIVKKLRRHRENLTKKGGHPSGGRMASLWFVVIAKDLPLD